MRLRLNRLGLIYILSIRKENSTLEYLFYILITWLATCGVVKLVTYCFDLPFSAKIATGVYIIVCFLKVVFGSSSKKEE